MRRRCRFVAYALTALLVLTGTAGATSVAAQAAPAPAPAPAPEDRADRAAAALRHGWDAGLLPTGTDARLRGLAPISRRVAWASGSGGTVLRTADGGRTVTSVGPPDTADLQFRDIEAFDADRAVVLSIGEGEASRIYRTDDGGASWTETFRNTDPAAFYDCIAFSGRRHGLALSDPVDGRFRILATDDGGRSWAVLPTAGMPVALPGEFAFAASGTCLVAAGREFVFATGGAGTARVFRSADRGLTWQVTDTPLRSGPTAGVYSLAVRPGGAALAVGGDFAVPDDGSDAAARSTDGGRTWTLAGRGVGGYRSGVAWLPYGLPVALAVGPTGTDVTLDAGRTWQPVDDGSFDAVACTADLSCWASGEGGRLAVLPAGR